MELNRMNSQPLSLTQYQQMLGQAIRMNPQLQGVWVVAELSDVRINGGHCYMELVEKDSAGATCAKLRAMIWSSSLHGLRRKFFEATGKDISTGMKVMVRGSASHHNLYGLSFTISDIDPSYTIGDIERLRREILERLRREGLLNLNRNQQLPKLLQRIAVVSAVGAAGYGDFINQLQSTPEGFKFYPFLFQAFMQGDKVSSSVSAALEMIESTIDLWDCVVIIRGGGSTTDLNGFDNYELARAVATFPLPVIVGIGHERDRTVLDEIACVRCKTPTAVAAWLIDAMRVNWTAIRDYSKRIYNYSSESLRGENYRLQTIEAALPARIKNGLLTAEKRLTENLHRLERALSGRTSNERGRVDRIGYRLESALKQFTERPKMKLQQLESMLRLLSPENILKRGYSITRVNGKAVLQVDDLFAGEVIETQVYGGRIYSNIQVVERIENEVNKNKLNKDDGGED